MNENLAYWQLDFTVESQANLAKECMVIQEKSESFRGPRRPLNPQAYFTPWPTVFSTRPSLSTIFRYFLQSLVSSLYKETTI